MFVLMCSVQQRLRRLPRASRLFCDWRASRQWCKILTGQYFVLLYLDLEMHAGDWLKSSGVAGRGGRPELPSGVRARALHGPKISSPARPEKGSARPGPVHCRKIQAQPGPVTDQWPPCLGICLHLIVPNKLLSTYELSEFKAWKFVPDSFHDTIRQGRYPRSSVHEGVAEDYDDVGIIRLRLFPLLLHLSYVRLVLSLRQWAKSRRLEWFESLSGAAWCGVRRANSMKLKVFVHFDIKKNLRI